jgi:hypothetical protein
VRHAPLSAIFTHIHISLSDVDFSDISIMHEPLSAIKSYTHLSLNPHIHLSWCYSCWPWLPSFGTILPFTYTPWRLEKCQVKLHQLCCCLVRQRRPKYGAAEDQGSVWRYIVIDICSMKDGTRCIPCFYSYVCVPMFIMHFHFWAVGYVDRVC